MIELNSLSCKELEDLAAAIRKRIIEVMSVNGGHLSSNLGIVELTIALHRVFESPKDKFIFDVSHQTYPHKLITGRADRFHQIRKYKGLCGFAHPKESEHDHFFAGHAGTALSLALGIAKARDLDGSKEHVIPILGDASLTCGLILEALNNVSKKMPRLIAILNDNDMSISENVGNIKSILKKPGSFFEEFGFSYIGPIDGHDIQKLVVTLEHIKNSDHPILLHVMTVKGKGMTIAADNPTAYHGVKPFDLCSGKFLPSPSNKPTFPKIFGRHILKMGAQEPNLVCITPATPAGSCMDDFMQRFPDRCFDVGIAEGHAVTFAGGLAKGGKKVICCIYATFLQRAFDNLFQDVCMQELPVIFALDRSFISGPDGSTHHGIYDIAFLNTMPNMIIAQPRNGHILKELLESSLHWAKPTAIRYPNLETDESDLPLQIRNPGKGEVLAEGKDLVLIGLGHTVFTCLKVRELLLQKSIEATVVDPVFLKPLDAEMLGCLIASHRFLVTVEEHSLNGGLGMILNHFLIQNAIQGLEVINIGIPDIWVQFGSNSELMRELGLDAESIAERILQEYHDHYPLSERKEKALL